MKHDFQRAFCSDGHRPYEIRNGRCLLCAVRKACLPATTSSDVEIAEKARVGRRSVVRAREILAEDGVIEIRPPVREIRVLVYPTEGE